MVAVVVFIVWFAVVVVVAVVAVFVYVVAVFVYVVACHVSSVHSFITPLSLSSPVASLRTVHSNRW